MFLQILQNSLENICVGVCVFLKKVADLMKYTARRDMAAMVINNYATGLVKIMRHKIQVV